MPQGIISKETSEHICGNKQVLFMCEGCFCKTAYILNANFKSTYGYQMVQSNASRAKKQIEIERFKMQTLLQ